MSRILRRPMFRGGPVSSYGTGIASGLADGGMPPKRGLVDGPGGYSGQGYYMGPYPNPDDLYKKGVTGANVVQKAKDKWDLENWMKNDQKIYGPSSIWGEKPDELQQFKDITGDGKVIDPYQIAVGPDDKIDMGEYLFASGDDLTSEDTDVYMKTWTDPEKAELIETKERYEKEKEEFAKKPENKGSDFVEFDNWVAIDKENQANKEELGMGGSGGPEILGITTPEKGNVNNQGKVIEPAESYEINADDVRAQAELFKELLGEKSDEKIKSARISDASDYALQFFRSTVGEGKGMKEAAGDVADLLFLKIVKQKELKQRLIK